MWTATSRFVTIAAILLSCISGAVAQQQMNWVAQIKPCEQSRELTKHDHMELGVWMNTSNPTLVEQFRRALEFWSHIVDMTWHERNSQRCSLQVVDGNSALFTSDVIAARSQLVDRQFFRGWIAFNPRCRLSELDIYLTAIHELGHTFGLQHNSNPKSVMYFLNPDAPPFLDDQDLESLARQHKLKSSSLGLDQHTVRAWHFFQLSHAAHNIIGVL